MSEPVPTAPPHPLRGWKEIAAHLGTSSRSAQRYAAELGMPVHRRGTRGASVAAYAEELDQWVRQQTPASLSPVHDDIVEVTPGADVSPETVPPTRTSHRRLLLVILAASLVAVVGWWSYLRVSATTDATGTSSPVTIGLRLNGREMQVRVVPGTPVSVAIRDGQSLWVTPTCEGDDLRIALREGPTDPHGATSLEVGSIVVRPARRAAADAVMFAYNDWTLELWWLPPSAKQEAR